MTERAHLRHSNNRLSLALKDYHDALVIHPGLPKALLGLAAVRTQMGDLSQATKALRQVLGSAQSDLPTRALAHLKLARMQSLPEPQQKRHLRSAIRLYRRLSGASATVMALMDELLSVYVRDRAYAAALVTARALYTQEPTTDRQTTLAALSLLANTTDTLSSAHPGANAARRAIERLSRHR